MKILVTRFSALGDTAMVAPVLKKIISENEWISITLLTRTKYASIFEGIERVRVISIDLDTEYNSIIKLLSYCKKLYEENKFDFYVDLHSVLRTWLIRGYLRIFGLKSAGLEKGRDARIDALRNRDIVLPNQTVRYLDVFRKACITVTNNDLLPLDATDRKARGEQLLQQLFSEHSHINSCDRVIGFAPFAAYSQKSWTSSQVQSFLQAFNSNRRGVLLLFGFGEKENKETQLLLDSIDNNVTIINCIGRWGMRSELDIISRLDVMVGMDSGNVHLASILGVRTIIIWGGTDSRFGFSPPFHNSCDSVYSDDSTISCRPCSVFGNRPCRYKTIRCMDTVASGKVLDLIYCII